MFSFFIVLLTLLLVLTCVVLILLVLVQLPKKDAGAGIAFGGGAADALFGAGSGNVLTKITKWAAGVFLGLSLLLGWMQGKAHTDNSAANFSKMVEQQQQQQAAKVPATQAKPQTPATTPAPANKMLLTTPTAVTNAPAPVAPAATNSAK
jgi:preprotein translocase subunit SecG